MSSLPLPVVFDLPSDDSLSVGKVIPLHPRTDLRGLGLIPRLVQSASAVFTFGVHAVRARTVAAEILARLVGLAHGTAVLFPHNRIVPNGVA